jgi:CRP/FNR family cyclic AMP-dependent transcriptional regulator
MFDWDVFNRLMKGATMDRSEIDKALRSSELFRGLEESDIQKISSLCQEEVYEPGQYVFRQGDFGNRICIIADGKVYLERDVDVGTRKGTVVIGILGRGRVFGCWSTLLNAPHNLMSSACCQGPTKIVSLKGSDLRGLMVSSTLLGFNVLEQLCFLLRDRIQGMYGAMEKI